MFFTGNATYSVANGVELGPLNSNSSGLYKYPFQGFDLKVEDAVSCYNYMVLLASSTRLSLLFCSYLLSHV